MILKLFRYESGNYKVNSNYFIYCVEFQVFYCGAFPILQFLKLSINSIDVCFKYCSFADKFEEALTIIFVYHKNYLKINNL